MSRLDPAVAATGLTGQQLYQLSLKAGVPKKTMVAYVTGSREPAVWIKRLIAAEQQEDGRPERGKKPGTERVSR